MLTSIILNRINSSNLSFDPNYHINEADLIIESRDITKQEIDNLLFQVTKKIRLLENKNNPITKIKHGKIEADIVRLKVFYKSRSRDFSLLPRIFKLRRIFRL